MLTAASAAFRVSETISRTSIRVRTALLLRTRLTARHVRRSLHVKFGVVMGERTKHRSWTVTVLKILFAHNTAFSRDSVSDICTHFDAEKVT